MTAGSYPDDGLGEVFLKLGKQGSTLAGVMDAFSIAISIALQYGVPLETYVQKFTNMRFEPAGLTDDPDIRMAQSMLDYIFRRLALDYLPFEDRAALGIYSASERTRQLETGSYAPTEQERPGRSTCRPWPSRPRSAPGRRHRRLDAELDDDVVAETAIAAPARVHSSTELLESLHRQLGRRPAVHELRDEDAPGRQLLRLRGMRQHQRLQLTLNSSHGCTTKRSAQCGPLRRASRG